MSTTWVEVSTRALEHNFQAVAAYANVAVCAVVKSNAYGHGLTESARVFERVGARWLAVTRVEEARALRASGVSARILILTPPPTPHLLAEAVSLECSITLSSADQLPRISEAASSANRAAPVHLKIDTGMGRLGVTPREAASVAAAISGQDNVVLEGIFTHFADASSEQGEKQLRLFLEAKSALGKHATRAIVHASNSAGLLKLPAAKFDMVRIGTLLYGQNPPGGSAPFALEETLTWKARVVAVRTVEAGDSIGYGSEYTATRSERVGTLAIGWADGFTAEPNARTPSLRTAARALARVANQKRVVFFDGVESRVLGRVGMQTVTVCLQDLPGVNVGDVAVIPARRLLINPSIERTYT